jgi:type IVB pilus formation R64 PilN family outer membrane protein
MNNFIKYSLGLSLVVLIGACSISTSMDATIEREIEATTELKEKAKTPLKADAIDVIRVKNDIWLGDKSIVEYEGAPIPNYLETKDGITLISNRPITLYEIGDMINKITSVKVRYAPQLEEQILENASENSPTQETINAHWTDPTKMLVSYRGPLSGLLDEISSRFGIWWRYEKNELYFYKFMTKTFVLYSLPTKQSLSASIGGSSTDSGSGGSSQINLTNAAELELWSNIEKSVTSMISKDASLSIDPANGTISLTATPNDIRKVAQYINEQNNRLTRQVAISVKVLQVSIDDSDQYAMDVSAMFKDAALNAAGEIDGGSGVIGGVTSAATGFSEDIRKNLTMNIFPGNWNINAAIQALSTQSNANLITSGTVTTLNNKPAPIQVVKKQNYISEITKTNSGGDTSSYDLSTETEEIETGFTMNVLPRILEHGRLLLMFDLTLSDLIRLEKVDLISGDTSGGEYIQNPIIESRGFVQEVALKSGESLVLTGYERVENTAEKTGVGSATNSLLGGAAKAGKNRSVLVIILTPVVLESPLNPETRVRN